MPVYKRPFRYAQRYQNMVNNAQGHFFEGFIKAACVIYSVRERAEISKTPEPFRVMEKLAGGIFKGRFTARAEPDFQGTLAGGRSIVFEAKHTTKDRIKRDALTEKQMELLAKHDQRGALAAVCVGIRDDCFFVPWLIWDDMKNLYGRQYVTAADLEKFRVKFNGAVMFLDYTHDIGGRWIRGADCDMEKWRVKSNEKATAENAESDGPGHAANGVQP